MDISLECEFFMSYHPAHALTIEVMNFELTWVFFMNACNVKNINHFRNNS
jgi:hypothetical protein